jgi:hypothetical protein
VATGRGDRSSLALSGDRALVAYRAGTSAVRVKGFALEGEPITSSMPDIASAADSSSIRTDLSASPRCACSSRSSNPRVHAEGTGDARSSREATAMSPLRLTADGGSPGGD